MDRSDPPKGSGGPPRRPLRKSTDSQPTCRLHKHPTPARRTGRPGRAELIIRPARPGPTSGRSCRSRVPRQPPRGSPRVARRGLSQLQRAIHFLSSSTRPPLWGPKGRPFGGDSWPRPGPSTQAAGGSRKCKWIASGESRRHVPFRRPLARWGRRSIIVVGERVYCCAIRRRPDRTGSTAPVGHFTWPIAPSACLPPDLVTLSLARSLPRDDSCRGARLAGLSRRPEAGASGPIKAATSRGGHLRTGPGAKLGSIMQI